MFKLSMLLGLALVLAPSMVQGKSLCRQSGYFAIVDNTPSFYACQSIGSGGYSLRVLRCPAGLVFSSSAAQCVRSIAAFETREDSNIENPTIPTGSPDEDTDSSTSVSTSEATEQTTPVASSSTEQPATDASSSTEQPATDASSSTEQTTTEASSSSEQPATDASSSSEQPDTDSSSSTESPATAEPVTSTTDEPTTDDSTTDESTTDDSTTDDSTTDESTTDEPSTETTEKDNVCATTGFLPAESCSHFIICYSGEGSALDSYVFQCPNNMQFDPYERVCSSEYDCTA